MYVGNLLQSEFTGKHNAGETHLRKELHLLHRAVVHLRTAMQRYGRDIHLQYRHILHYKRIHANFIQLLYQPLGRSYFGIGKYGVERDIYLDTEQVGILDQARNIVDRIAGSLACTELRCTNVHRIGPAIHGSNSRFKITGRR